jgi:large subunit ribosomal protein L24
MLKNKISEKKIKCNFIKGDKVIVITGNDKGKIGEVLEIDRVKNSVKVTGVRIQTHFVKADGVGTGGLIKKEGFINISNISHVCENGKPTKIKRIRTENGLKIFSKKTNEDLRLKSHIKQSAKISLEEDKLKKETEKIKKEKFKEENKEKDTSFHEKTTKGKKKGDK